MKTNKYPIVAIAIIWMAVAFIALKCTTKLTYLEYQYENEIYDDCIELSNNNDYFDQKFISPYGIIHGVSIKISTFDRDNNSIWNIALIDATTNNILYNQNYNADLIDDGSFHLFEFNKNVRVTKGNEYIIRVSAIKVDESTSIGYYVGENEVVPDIVNNGKLLNKTLCFAVYGGDFDSWWIFYIVIITIAISIAIIRWAIVSSKQINPKNDKLLGSLITAFIVLLLLNSFSVADGFMDEWDNIRGGMIIARGGILYRDYVTQHTPVMYYLCSVFALLGAGSVQQFRLSYYFFEAVIWGLLYYRHASYFGKRKIIILTISECMAGTMLGCSYGYTILSDSLQGLCMTVLLLEFVRYCADRSLEWDRSIIVSLSVWGCIGSAFISVYSIFFVFITVLCLEILWYKNNRLGVVGTIKRYYKLLVSLLIPLFCAIIYFMFYQALRLAFEQFYVFNREVYSDYISTGDNVIEPFVISLKTFFGIIGGTITSILSSNVTTEDVLQFIIVTIAVVVIADLCIKKRYKEGASLCTIMAVSLPRGNGFHGIPAWYVTVLIIVIFGEDVIRYCIRKVTIPISAIIVIFLICPYIQAVGTNLLYEQQPISDIESRIVAITEENEDILIDTCYCDSIYLCYKNRYPANRICFMGLAWYMDWFEQDAIDDMHNRNPRVVVFNPDEGYWCNSFRTELRKNYVQLSDYAEDEWKYCVWVIK